jgi:hypothetical protein
VKQTLWPPRRQRIVVADNPGAMATLRAALGSIVDLVRVDTVEDALVEVASGADMVICGLHFGAGGEGTAMFQLLQRLDGAKPIICLRDIDTSLRGEEHELLARRCADHGAAHFLDIHGLRKAHGTVGGYRRFRLAVLACLDEAERRRSMGENGERSDTPALGG